jgi:hypothetical protein
MVGEHKGRLYERRQDQRVDISVPLTIKIIGAAQSVQPLTAETNNVSLKGLSIGIKIKAPSAQGHHAVEERGGLNQYLFLSNKRLKLEINILPGGRSIPAIGKVRWYDKNWKGGAIDVRAGIVIEEMEYGHRVAWADFLRALYQFLISLGN